MEKCEAHCMKRELLNASTFALLYAVILCMSNANEMDERRNENKEYGTACCCESSM